MGLTQDKEQHGAGWAGEKARAMQMPSEQSFGDQVPGASASLLTTADASPVISRLFGTRTGVKGTKVRKILLCILGNSMGFSSMIILCIHKTKPAKSP